MPKLYTQKEKERRRMRFQIFAGMFDFLAVLVGIIVIIACVILLISLVRWVAADVPVTFSTIFEILKKAIIVPV